MVHKFGKLLSAVALTMKMLLLQSRTVLFTLVHVMVTTL